MEFEEGFREGLVLREGVLWGDEVGRVWAVVVAGGGIADWREDTDSEFVVGGVKWGLGGGVVCRLCVWGGGGGWLWMSGGKSFELKIEGCVVLLR